jgi:hypothetical protein
VHGSGSLNLTDVLAHNVVQYQRCRRIDMLLYLYMVGWDMMKPVFLALHSPDAERPGLHEHVAVVRVGPVRRVARGWLSTFHGIEVMP